MGCLSKRVLLLVGGVCLSACVAAPAPYHRAVPQGDEEIAFAKNILEAAQVSSFETGRESCGYIGLGSDGNLVATPPKRGRKNSCRPDEVPEGFTRIASYHTHGTFSENYESEFPSVDDVDADVFEGRDGYVATPGGRVWFIDGYRMTAKVLCGENCVSADPAYIGDIKLGAGQRYTLGELERLHEAVD